MKKTDYSKIASVYDENRDRLNIPVDKTLESLLADGRKVRVLDLACGTGNNIKAQSEYFPGSNVEWFGVDLSPEMLAIARSKAPHANLTIGNAEALTLADNSFDYITCNFAFHHFGNKISVLDNVRRLLTARGAFKIRNVVPEYMRNWWVYNYSPEAYFQDLHRFWTKDLMLFELEKRGFQTNVSVSYENKNRSIQKIHSEYIKRDNSQLATLSEQAYVAGLKRIEKEMDFGVTDVKSEFALIEVEAIHQ